jgi:hypothetical protein
VPVDVTARRSSKMIPGAILKVYEGAPHGMCTTLKDRVNADLLEFIGTRQEQKVEKRKVGGGPEVRRPEVQV